MKKLLFLLILFSSLITRAQFGWQTDSSNAFHKNYTAASFSYLGEQVLQNPYDNRPDYHEFTYRLEYAHQLGKHLILGLDARYITTRYDYGPVKNDFYLAALNAKYIALQRKVLQFYLLGGIGSGNYCYCEENALYPTQRNDTWYAGLGYGMLGKLTDHLYLDLAIAWYIPLGVVDDYYSYAHYIFGLGYNF